MAGGHEGHDHWHVVDVAYDAETGRGMGASAVPAQRGAVGVQPCHHVAAQRGAVQPFYHVVADRRPRQRARVAASTVCAGLLVAASVAVGRGWASRAVLHEEQVLDARIVFPAGARPAAITPASLSARPRALAPETVLITVPEGALVGQKFYFDVPGRGEYGTIVPEGKTPGDVLELEVTGSGAPIRSLAQRPYEDAVRASAVGPKAIKHVMYKTVVSRAGEQNGHFRVDIPGRGLVDVAVPAGKQVGDELRFQLPPPDVGLRPDYRPGLAHIVRGVEREQASVTLSKPEEVRVTVPQGVVAGETLEVQGQGGTEFELKVPGSVSGDKPDSTFLAILPSAPEPAAVKTAMGGIQRSSLAGRTQALAVEDEKLANGDSSLSDAVTSAVTDAVQEAVQQAATQAAAEAAAENASAAPAPAVPAEAAAPLRPPAVPAAGAAEAVSPAGASDDAFGHRDAEEAFNNGQPIVQQEVPDEYEGEAVAGPTASTNHFQVTVYEPVTQKGRRSRGIANTWNFQNEVLCARMVGRAWQARAWHALASACGGLQLLTSDVLQAWQYDAAKARTQADFSWLDEPGVWQQIDSYAVQCPSACVRVIRVCLSVCPRVCLSVCPSVCRASTRTHPYAVLCPRRMG
jgi:hypothetical protein